MERRTPFDRRYLVTARARCRPHLALVGLFCATLIGLPQAQGSDLDGDVFEHRKLEIKFTVPEGWKLTRQTGYPSLLAFVGRDSSRIALSYTRLTRQQKVIQIVTDNSRALEALGLRVEPPKNTDRLGRKLWLVQARTADGLRGNQQLYVPAGQVVYVLTLSAPSSEIQRAQADLDYLLASMKFKRWPLSDEGLVRERGRQGAAVKTPPPVSRRALPELSTGPSLPTEHGEEPQTKAAPREVEERAQGRRGRRGRRLAPLSRPTSSRPASSRPTSSRPTSSRPTSSMPAASMPTSSAPAAPPSAKTAPKLPTAPSRSQTR